MSILVTGGLGLLGRQTLELLAAAGRVAVSYDRAAPAGDTVAGVEYVTGDLNDYPHLVETVRRHEVEAIIHTAAASGPMVRAEAPFEVCQWNIMGTVAVYEVARLFGLRRVVYCSSNAVYGHTGRGPVTEESPLHPLSVYGATKAAGELLGESYAAQFGLDVLALRLGHVFGPRRATQCYVREMVRNALEGGATVYPDGGAQASHLIYIKDAAAALVAALDAPAPQHRVVNVSLERTYTRRELGAVVADLVPGARIEFGPGTWPHVDQQAALDLARLREALGIVPAYTLETALAEYVAWLRMHER
jgi:nucleoside-diphosphate-sugar epimerase